MERYWDKTEKERAAMTAEEVEQFLDIELMENGIVRPVPLNLEEKQPVDVGEKVTKYGVTYKGGRYSWKDDSDFYFDTAEQAQALIGLSPMACDHDSSIGDDYEYLKPLTDFTIITKTFHSRDQVTRVASALARNKEIEDQNSKKSKEFNEANEGVNKALEGLWEDWYACRDKHEKHLRIKKTYDGYVATADGNVTLARKFLAKAYTMDEINAAFEWFEIEVIGVELVEEATSDERG